MVDFMSVCLLANPQYQPQSTGDNILCLWASAL